MAKMAKRWQKFTGFYHRKNLIYQRISAPVAKMAKFFNFLGEKKIKNLLS
ncbi:MAG: hypothetical protein IJT27_02990 [Clostridia bacterium]|nr:hypothetical protein [Clostridia bacterium]